MELEDLMYSDATENYKQKNYLKALDSAEMGLKFKPEDIYLLFLSAKILIKLSNYKKALERIEKCKKINSKEVTFYLLQAECYEKLDIKRNDILQFYKEIIFNNPTSSSAYLSYGIYLYKLKKCKESITYLKKSIELGEQEKRVDFFLIKCLNILGDYKEADIKLSNLKNDYMNSGKEADFHQLKAEILRRRYKYISALDEILSAIKLNPQNWSYQKERILILYWCRRFQDVIDLSLSQFVEKDKKSNGLYDIKQLYLFIGSSYLNLGQLNKFKTYMNSLPNYAKESELYYLEMAKYYYISKNINLSFENAFYSLKANPYFVHSILFLISLYKSEGKMRLAENIKLKNKDLIERFYQNSEINCDNNQPKIKRNDLLHIETVESFDEKIEGSKQFVHPHSSMKISLNICPQVKLNQNSIELIGKGGFAKVYKGVFGDEIVAIKIFDRTKVNINEIIQESMKMFKLVHKNIISIRGVFCDRIYIQYAFGKDLKRLLCEVPNLPLKFKFKLLQGISEGLQYLHKQNIIHGDLKASNILLDQAYNENSNVYPNPKISDFGLSLNVGEKGVKGWTRQWAAPEIFENICTTQLDIYSFGMTVYEIMTQKTPFYHISQPQQRYYPNQLDMSILESLNLPDIWALVKICTEYRPEKRPNIDDIVNYISNMSKNYLI